MTATISSLDLFPVLNSNSPNLPPYNILAPIQMWQAALPILGTGNYAYPCLDPTTGAVTVKIIPVAQANAANVPPANLPTGSSVNTAGTNPPPINLTAYNALAGENEQVVATPFGLMLEGTTPAPAPTVQQGTDSQNIAAILALSTKIPTQLGIA